MKDKALTYAVVISVVAHLAAVTVICRTSASRLSPASIVPAPRFIQVELTDEPKPQPKPEPASVTQPHPVPPPQPRVVAPPIHDPVPADRAAPRPDASRRHAPPPNRPETRAHTPAGNPGGRLNTGSTSAQGDLPGNWTGGKTPVGWVPGDESRTGKGSGNSVGTSTPDPPRHASDGSGTRPSPPPPPPAPRTVSIKVCSVSGLLPNRHCERTRSETFTEGGQPGRTCDRCKEPEPVHNSRLADSSDPVLVKDSHPSVPGSVEEGLTLRATIRYTVTANGGVEGVEIEKSSGHKAVDKAVVSAASKMKYKPAVQDGVPRAVKRTRTYVIKT